MSVMLLVKVCVCFCPVLSSMVVTKVSLWMSIPQTFCFVLFSFFLVTGRCFIVCLVLFFIRASELLPFYSLKSTHRFV
jgi:hypothetical protein